MEATREWLRDNAPANVLMPCKAKGSKVPMHVHKNGAWTWASFDAIQKDCFSNDVGLLLQDLCVVDVDNDALSTQLEADYPELTLAPCERTRKGRHYFFRRSTLSDADGYYDGAAQVQKGVDFKTVCSQGTSGFVVIAPSTDKRWVRPLWATPVAPIGDALLRRVAVPKHARVTIEFALPSGRRVAVQNRFVMQFSTVRQFAEDFPGKGLAVDTCERHLEDLFFCCEHGVTRRVPTRAEVADVLRLADFMGVPRRFLGAFRCGGPVHRLLDVERVWPEMAAHLHAEMLARKHVGAVATVPVVLFRRGTSAGPTLDGNWLFPSDRVSSTPQVASDTEVLPAFVASVLRKHPGRVVLAGGGALATAVPATGPPNDFDLFLVDVDEESAIAVVHSMCADPGCKVVYRSKSAITMLVKKNAARSSTVQVQVILRRYSSVASLLSSFDVAPCKVCVIAETDGTLSAHAMPIWHASMRDMCFVADLDVWGTASFARVLKYAARGFRVYVPCTSRDCFAKNPARPAGGVDTLFAFERIAREYPVGFDENAQRYPFPSKSDVARGVRRFRRAWGLQDSDYGTVKKMAGSLRYWCRWLMRRASWKHVDVTLSPNDVPLVSNSSNFFPCSLGWSRLYDSDAWMRHYVGMLGDIGENLVDYVRNL